MTKKMWGILVREYTMNDFRHLKFETYIITQHMLKFGKYSYVLEKILNSVLLRYSVLY